VTHAISQTLKWLLQLLLPAPGRHRAAVAQRPATAPHADKPALRPSPLWREIGLVRPHLVAHERRQAQRLQRRRRRTLWLAVHGTDVGPRLIHGMEVATR
jgi:hypothetical protein